MNTPFTGIVLAGGASRRMGQNKAQLTLLGKTLLEHQIEKLRQAGASEILISGKDSPPLPNTSIIADILPDRGPLGGLHACLKAAYYPTCLILSVDVPLIPVATLRQLAVTHVHGATVLRHGKHVEPLIGMYDSALAEVIYPLIETGGAPVRALEHLAPWEYVDYQDDEALLCNCNTPQEFEQMEQFARRIAKQIFD